MDLLDDGSIFGVMLVTCDIIPIFMVQFMPIQYFWYCFASIIVIIFIDITFLFRLKF